MRRLGIIGFGSFGRFAAGHLNPHFEVLVSDREFPSIDPGSEPRLEGVVPVSVEMAAACELVVLAVPVQTMETLLTSLVSAWTPGALVVEVASVKERPAEILERTLPRGVRYLGLHPMFGPQSGKDGIAGLKVVRSHSRDTALSASDDQHRCVTRFLEQLGLTVLAMNAADHDREMAYIQGLTHWIAKALREIQLPSGSKKVHRDLATPAYRHLLKIEEILREDSLELF